jgi:hypothetical protein
VAENLSLAAGDLLGRLGRTLRQGDIALALGMIGILVVLILPVPRLLLDMLLALSITFSVLVLLTSLFIVRPLEFSGRYERAELCARRGAQGRHGSTSRSE